MFQAKGIARSVSGMFEEHQRTPCKQNEGEEQQKMKLGKEEKGFGA